MKRGSPQVWGAMAAVIGLLADQATKIWLLGPFELAEKGRVAVLPFLDLVLVWNRGISYGLFPQAGDWGRYALILIGLSGAILFAVWLARANRLLVALALGLIAGGAIANVIDRIRFGAVVDFALLHAGNFEWYVFNLADVWIVAGVIGLLIGWTGEAGRPEKATDD